MDAERADLATYDHEFLFHDEIERGPRCIVWTFRPSALGTLKMQHSPKDRIKNQLEGANPAEALFMSGRQHNYMLACSLRDGRNIYAVVRSTGVLIQWDVKLKRELSSSLLGSTLVTGVASWETASQILIASQSQGQICLRVFDDRTPIMGVTLTRKGEVKRHRASVWHRDRRTRTNTEVLVTQTDASMSETACEIGKNWPPVCAVYHVEGTRAIIVFDHDGEDPEATALVVDLDKGTSNCVDIYGDGPPEDRFAQLDEDALGQDCPAAKVDRLVTLHTVELNVGHSSSGRTLVLLYDSNRLCHFTFHDEQLYEQMLLDEGTSIRNRSDKPIEFAVLTIPELAEDVYNLVVAYHSMVIRCWFVTLSRCRLQAQLNFGHPLFHLVALNWPTPPAAHRPSTAKPSALRLSGKERRSCLALQRSMINGFAARRRSSVHRARPSISWPNGTATAADLPPDDSGNVSTGSCGMRCHSLSACGSAGRSARRPSLHRASPRVTTVPIVLRGPRAPASRHHAEDRFGVGSPSFRSFPTPMVRPAIRKALGYCSSALTTMETCIGFSYVTRASSRSTLALTTSLAKL